jgi:hypothetical protein
MSTPIAGLSPTPNDHPAPHLSLELNAGDDDFAWLNIVEHEGVEKIADVCVECWQSAGPEAKKKSLHYLQLQEYSLQYASMAIFWPSVT